MVTEKDKVKEHVVELNIDKFNFCYFDKGNLQVMCVKVLKISTGP